MVAGILKTWGHRGRCLFFALLIFFSPFLSLSAVRAEVKITILHVNDLHGRILPHVERTVDRENPVGGAAHLAAMIAAERAKNPRGTLLLSAGDMFQGTPISNSFRGRPVLEVMNRLQFDAMVLGNHEFDWGRNVLDDLRVKASFPFLIANVKDAEGRPLKGFRPYVILQRKGLKIAVIGLTTPETAYTTKPEHVKGLLFREPEKELPALLEETKREGARFWVLLTHLGLDEDRRLAAAVPGIHVIVGGHSHTVASDPVAVGKTVIVQAGSNGLYLGVLNLILDEKTGRVVKRTSKHELKPVYAGPGRPFDKDVAGTVAAYNEKIKDVFQQVLGETAVDLKKTEGESNLGNAITDAMRASMQADIAIHNSGGIRADIPKGKITVGQVYTALPFDDVLMAMDLKGKQIRRILEKGAARPGMLQLSGLKVTLDPTRSPGNRVVKAWVGEEDLDSGKTYRVVTNDFLASGGDGFLGFKEGTNVTRGGGLRKVFGEYIREKSPLSPAMEGRIEVR